MMKHKMEEFRDVKGYEGIYQVSNLGNVKSLKFGKERILKTNIGGGGYLKVLLCKDGLNKNRTVHQLVAVAFLNHIPNRYKIVVNHIDFDKTNNNADNLELITQRNNTNKKHLKSSSKYTGVCLHKATNKWQSTIVIDGRQKHLGYFKCELEAHNAYQLELNKIKIVQKQLIKL